MGEFVEKTKALGDKVAGNVKEGVGDATDNQRLHDEGKAQQAEGTAHDIAGTIKGKLGDDI